MCPAAALRIFTVTAIWDAVPRRPARHRAAAGHGQRRQVPAPSINMLQLRQGYYSSEYIISLGPRNIWLQRL